MSYFWHTSVLYRWSEKMPSNWYFRLQSLPLLCKAFARSLIASLVFFQRNIEKLFFCWHVAWDAVVCRHLLFRLTCKEHSRNLPFSSFDAPPDVVQRSAPWEGIQDSLGVWIPRRGFRIPATGFQILCQWNLDSIKFQSLIVFQIPWAVFWRQKPSILFIPKKKKSRILNCTNKIKISLMPESGFLYKGRKDSRTWDPAWCWSYILILYISCF